MNWFLTAVLSVMLMAMRTEAAFISSKVQGSARLNDVSLYNIFDDLQLIFSEEGKKNRAAYEERERREMEEAQEEILRRRRNPELMEDYERSVDERRLKLSKEKEVWNFQNKVSDDDPMIEWNKLREEGKIQVGSDLERDESSRRLGSEGLVEVRVDERMPYIDQGYVDPDADLIGNFMKLFGGGKKDEK